MNDPDYRRIEMWRDVPEEQWDNYRWQLQNRIVNVDQLKRVLPLHPEEEEGARRVEGRFVMSIPPYWVSLMDRTDPRCPIRKQAVPVLNEFYIDPTDMVDPCGEEKDAAVPNVVHRYPDRVLFLVTGRCAMYCRYCTRSRLVGSEGREIYEYEPAFEYIKSNRKIRDVLISGGDPLSLSDEKLEAILKRLREISHVEFIRIGTRMPCTLPMRITESFCAMIKRQGPIWMSLHFNHPKEVTKRVKKACDMLAESGVPMGSQTVLLRGVNDKPYIMKKLFHELLKVRVRPYYIYQCDPVKGTAHFRTPVSVGLNIIEKLRGWTTGYAVPTYVVDGPGGGGKIPITPNYVISHDNGVWTLRNFEGKIFKYYEVEPSESPAEEPAETVSVKARKASAA